MCMADVYVSDGTYMTVCSRCMADVHVHVGDSTCGH